MSNSTNQMNSSNAAAKRATLSILDQLLPRHLMTDIGLRLWDGTLWPDGRVRPTTVVLNFPGALRTIFASGTERGLGEGFLRDEFDIEGEIEPVLQLAENLGLTSISPFRKVLLATKLLQLPRSQTLRPRAPAKLVGQPHSIERARAAVAYHYNASNEFYALWLDPRMVYSCAYFRDEKRDIEQAQFDKLNHICRKLRLKPGQKLLDVGCGWGALVLHASKYFGVDATGITLSQPQVELARQRIQEAGVSDRCRVELRDYREIKTGQYDAIASIGMFEHVGAALLPEYFERAFDLLWPGGVFLNHGIAYNATRPAPKAGNFIETYVFPDGETVPLNLSLQHAEESHFEIRDVESLREHYALTLRAWVKRLEANRERAVQMTDEATYRVWRLYMASSAYGFATNRITVFQTLLAKNDERGHNNLPLTREDWYGEA